MDNFHVLKSITCRAIYKIVISKDEMDLFTQFLSLIHLFYWEEIRKNIIKD